jgi:hypothetical protein
MQCRHVAAALGSLVCAILAASCLQEGPTATSEDTGSWSTAPASGTEPTREAPQDAVFERWVFKVIVKDDGQDVGGGWQEAHANVPFVTWSLPPHFFTCPVTVSMPLRTERYGCISAERAAKITNKITDDAADELYSERDWNHQSDLYCAELIKKMGKLFHDQYLRLGARVTR